MSTQRAGKRRAKRRRPQRAGHIDGFFNHYPQFKYDSSAPVWSEFNRMCEEFGWDSDDYELRQAKREFKAALVQEFNKIYGTDEASLDSWQSLCLLLNIQPTPADLQGCRERVRQTHVNLVDLVDVARTGESVTVFPNLEQLRDYTVETGKFFPKNDAHAGGLLRYLLRKIIS
ncbi:hypothetical protein RB599_004461 [Gaeumannomyces hyphopodioides]